MVEQVDSQYVSMLELSVAVLESLGIEEKRAIELTRDATKQYYHKGQYSKRCGVSEDMHNIFREIVKPYAKNIATSNKRRCELIDREIKGTLEQSEKEELERLQGLVMDFINHVAPLPVGVARRLYARGLNERLRRKVQD